MKKRLGGIWFLSMRKLPGEEPPEKKYRRKLHLYQYYIHFTLHTLYFKQTKGWFGGLGFLGRPRNAWCTRSADAGGPGAWKVFCLGGETKKLTLRRKWLGKLPGNWRPNLLWELLRNFGSDFGSYFGTLEVTLEVWKLLWKFGSDVGSVGSYVAK